MKQNRRTIIGRLLDELELVENMEFISYDTKHKAKQEILKNIEAYEKGWKKENEHFICE